jgi:hypothetical protein
MGRAKRNPSLFADDGIDGFRCALPILRIHTDSTCQRISTRGFAFSRRKLRPRDEPLRPKRGRGECRAPDAPAASCAKVESTRVRNCRFTGSTRHSRTRLVLTAYSALSSVLRLVGRRRPAKRLAGLDPSVGRSGPHAFAVRVSAPRQRAPSASIASCSNVRDDRDTLLKWDRTAQTRATDLPDGASGFFGADGVTREVVLISVRNFIRRRG